MPSRQYSKYYRLHFNEDGVLCVPRVEHTKSAPVLHKADLKRDDWIVKKDGVVYEEYPIGKMRFIEQRVPLDTVKKYFGDRYDELKTPIIADQVNEDWLEKKMLCFMKRVYIAGGIERCDKKVDGSITEVITPDLEDVLIFNCENEDCHFCCSEESECEVCFPDVSKEDKAQGAIDQPRKKVTVEDILWLLDRYVDALSIYHNALSAGDEPIVEKHTLMSLNKHYLMREIKYLVSLQEK